MDEAATDARDADLYARFSSKDEPLERFTDTVIGDIADDRIGTLAYFCRRIPHGDSNTGSLQQREIVPGVADRQDSIHRKTEGVRYEFQRSAFIDARIEHLNEFRVTSRDIEPFAKMTSSVLLDSFGARGIGDDDGLRSAAVEKALGERPNDGSDPGEGCVEFGKSIAALAIVTVVGIELQMEIYHVEFLENLADEIGCYRPVEQPTFACGIDNPRTLIADRRSE